MGRTKLVGQGLQEAVTGAVLRSGPQARQKPERLCDVPRTTQPSAAEPGALSHLQALAETEPQSRGQVAAHRLPASLQLCL